VRIQERCNEIDLKQGFERSNFSLNLSSDIAAKDDLCNWVIKL
jgi:hypothetical protein